MGLEELLRRELGKRRERRKPRHIESSIQSGCVTWFRLQYPKYIIFSVPNGGSRNEIEAGHLKEEGALSGVSDLVLIAEKSVLFIEMKAPKGRQQETQKRFQRDVERLGFKYYICRSLSEFQMTVERWIKEISSHKV